MEQWDLCIGVISLYIFHLGWMGPLVNKTTHAKCIQIHPLLPHYHCQDPLSVLTVETHNVDHRNVVCAGELIKCPFMLSCQLNLGWDKNHCQLRTFEILRLRCASKAAPYSGTMIGKCTLQQYTVYCAPAVIINTICMGGITILILLIVVQAQFTVSTHCVCCIDSFTIRRRR